MMDTAEDKVHNRNGDVKVESEDEGYHNAPVFPLSQKTVLEQEEHPKQHLQKKNHFPKGKDVTMPSFVL